MVGNPLKPLESGLDAFVVIGTKDAEVFSSAQFGDGVGLLKAQQRSTSHREKGLAQLW